MDLTLQRRRLSHAGDRRRGVSWRRWDAASAFCEWGMWLFGAAIIVGFASHGWLMLGVLREKPSR